MQNQRLEENGYEPIDFQGMMELPEEDFEAVISTYTEPEPIVEETEEVEDDDELDINEKQEVIDEIEYLENLTNDKYEL
jgi:hypothetical protein